MTLSGTVTSAGLPSFTNTASVSLSDQQETAYDKNSSSEFSPVQSADLAVTKTVDNAAPNVGGTITFTVTVKNNGPSDATNVTIADRSEERRVGKEGRSRWWPYH